MDLGHQLISFSSVPSSRRLDDRGNLITKISWKIGFPLDINKVNVKIKKEVINSMPDIIWIEKGNTIFPWTLKKIKQVSPEITIVSYSEDDMYASHNRSLYYRYGLKYYDFVFTTKSYNCDQSELPTLGARRVIFVDKSYDTYQHKPIDLSAEDLSKYGSEVGFIGAFEEERAASILYLARKGVKVRVWGTEWHKMTINHPNLILENHPVYGLEYVKAICATRINLCFLRKMNRDLQTDRTMEIPACQGFMLAERTEEHLRLFTEGEEAAYFGSNEELLQKVRYYLIHEEERQKIAHAGRKRCVDSGYSHHERLKFMLSKVLGL